MALGVLAGDHENLAWLVADGAHLGRLACRMSAEVAEMAVAWSDADRSSTASTGGVSTPQKTAPELKQPAPVTPTPVAPPLGRRGSDPATAADVSTVASDITPIAKSDIAKLKLSPQHKRNRRKKTPSTAAKPAVRFRVDDLAESEMGDGDDDTPHPFTVRPTSFSMPEFAFVVSTKASGTEKDAEPKGSATEKAAEPPTAKTGWDDLYGDLVSPDGVVRTDTTTTEAEVEPTKTDDETDPNLSPVADSTSHGTSDGTGTDANVPSCYGHSSGPQYEPYKYSYDDTKSKTVAITHHPDGSVTQYSHFPAGAWDEAEQHDAEPQEPEVEENVGPDPEVDHVDNDQDYADDYDYDDYDEQDY